MSEESFAAITAEKSGQQLDKSKIWRLFKDRTIFQSTKRPGVCIEINNGVTTVINSQGDIHCNDTTQEELKSYHPYFVYQLSEDEDTLFNEFHTLGNDFTILGSELRPVVSEMIDHFRYKNGIDYKNTTLTNHVKKNNESVQYKNTIEEILKYELKKRRVI